MCSLYILEIKPLSEVSLTNIFSHMAGSFFILMLFSLVVQKLFYFNFLLLFNYSCVPFLPREAFYFDEILFIYSFLYVPCSRGHISENIAAWNI